MLYSKILYFSAGVILGAIIATLYADVKKSDKEEEAKTDSIEDSDDEEIKYKDTSTLDDYEAFKQQDMTDYSKMADKYATDPADAECPTEDSIEITHNELRHRQPIEITRTEYGTFGYDTLELYYNEDLRYLWEDGEEPLDDDTALNYCGQLLVNGFEDGKTDMYIRNFRLQTDVHVTIYNGI